jgi:Na+/proline symporter
MWRGALAAYMAAVLWIGVWAGRRKEHGDDFFLAGRSMPSWAVAAASYTMLGGLLTISILAAAQQAVSSGPVQVTIDKPVKIILEDIGYMVRGSHPLPIKQK